VPRKRQALVGEEWMLASSRCGYLLRWLDGVDRVASLAIVRISDNDHVGAVQE
jgi:hypothetical protein